MSVHNEIIDAHVSLMTGDDGEAGAGLTDWLNGYAASVEGELIPCDLLLGYNIKPPNWTMARTGTYSTSRVPHQFSTGRGPGVWSSLHAFQTCQFLWWIMQTDSTPTSEGDPGVGYNTHTLSIGLTNTPKWNGIHFEREGITSNELRYDLYGLLPSDLTINCGQSANWKATQEITIPYAFLKRDASDITAQTPRPVGTTGSLWKDWMNLITGNGGGAAPSGLKYDSAQLEVDVINMSLKFHRDIYFGPGSASSTANQRGTPLTGMMLGWDYSIVLDVIPIGDLLYTVNNTKQEDYSNNLAFEFYFTGEATNDKIKFTYDTLYMLPFDELNDYNKYIEGYTITLVPYDKASTFVCVGIDNLDNTHFENP